MFGKKFKHWVHKTGKKAVKVAKTGNKLLHKVDKISGAIEKGIDKATKITQKLEGIPVIGSAAGVASASLKQIGTGVKVGRRGVKGLEKGAGAVSAVYHSTKKPPMTAAPTAAAPSSHPFKPMAFG